MSSLHTIFFQFIQNIANTLFAFMFASISILGSVYKKKHFNTQTTHRLKIENIYTEKNIQ